MVQVREVIARSALNRVSGMPFRWSLNPYRGCVHDCQYCFARVTHRFLELDADEFAGVLTAKMNVAHVLRSELTKRTWHRERVAIGTATDPYQPVEGRYRLTRGCLEVLAERRTPFTLVTKGTMVVRDRDVLAAAPGATVCISLPTIDVELSRQVEPGTPPPRQRLRALAMLRDAGIDAGVMVAPMLPGLTTCARHVDDLLRAAADAGATFVSAGVLHLRPGVREYFMAFLERTAPSLVPRYERLYRGSKARQDYRDRVHAQVEESIARAGLISGKWHPNAEDGPRQLSLSLE